MRTPSSENNLIIPQLDGFYRSFAEPLAFLALRVSVGALMVVEGWPKINDPTGMAGFVEALGFHPGWLWSSILAVLQFAGGIMLILGLLTRPIALALGFMLAITLWFHLTTPYGAAILTPEGIAAVQANAQLLTGSAQAPLLNLPADGGASFLHQVQFKANGFSFLWTIATFVFAAYGAGRISVDRMLGREF